MTAILGKQFWVRAGQAGFVAVWLAGVTVLAWTYLAGLVPVYPS